MLTLCCNFLLQEGDLNCVALSERLRLGLITSPKYLLISLFRQALVVADLRG